MSESHSTSPVANSPLHRWRPLRIGCSRPDWRRSRKFFPRSDRRVDRDRTAEQFAARGCPPGGPGAIRRTKTSRSYLAPGPTLLRSASSSRLDLVLLIAFTIYDLRARSAGLRPGAFTVLYSQVKKGWQF